MDITLAGFALVALLTIATPGPTVLLALTNGSRYGMRQAGYGMLGAAASDLVLIGAAALGLGALLAASEFWFSVVKGIGVIYLAYVGIQMLRPSGDAGTAVAACDGGGVSGRALSRRLFRKSFLVAATNPKGYLFFAAFLPQFVDTSAPIATQYATLAATFVLIDLAVMAIYAGFGSHAARHLQGAGVRWIEGGCGAVLLALAGMLALYRRQPV